jgi:hypothetical protein
MAKRGYHWREGDQVPTRTVPIREIMLDPAFVIGFADVRAGRSYHPNYDRWADTNARWSYERGRQFATLAPKGMPLKRGGKLNPKAVALYGFYDII